MLYCLIDSAQKSIKISFIVLFNVTSTTATVNLVYSDVARANSINATTIITTTTFRANGNNLSATIHKDR